MIDDIYTHDDLSVNYYDIAQTVVVVVVKKAVAADGPDTVMISAAAGVN